MRGPIQPTPLSIKHEAIVRELNKYLCSRFNYKKEFALYSFYGSTVTARSVKFDIYLRLLDEEYYKDEETLVVARLFYRETRKGHGSDFLKFLSKIALKNNFQLLAFENCNENSRKFVENFGFKKGIKHSHHYNIEVKDLIAQFS